MLFTQVLACRFLINAYFECAVLTCIFLHAQVVQERTPVGNLVSGPMLALGMGLALAATGVLPLSCDVYGVVFESLLPFASALLLLESDLRQ
jgi:uncharacterized membrane protein